MSNLMITRCHMSRYTRMSRIREGQDVKDHKETDVKCHARIDVKDKGGYMQCASKNRCQMS